MVKFVKEIEGLRCLAVVSVIIFHLNPNWLPGGFVGVDIFFVISGYVVALSLYNRDISDLPRYFWGFYRRRFVRIYPALLFCLIFSAIFVTFFLPKFYVSRFIDETAIYAFFGLSNFVLAFNGESYFTPSTDFNPFVHTWSLGVEEQYYLIFPLIMYFWCLDKFKSMIFFLFFSSLAISIYLSLEFPNYAYYLLPSRLWELAAGAILFMYHCKDEKVLPEFGVRSIYLGAGLILVGFVFSDKSNFPFPWAIFPVLGTCLVVNAVVVYRKKTYCSSLLQSKLFTHFGRLSYSLYLWHWPIFSFFRWTVGLDSLLNIISAISLTYGFSTFSYYLVEQRFLSAIWIKTLNARTIVIACIAITTVSAYITYEGLSAQHRLSFSTTVDKNIWHPHTKIESSDNYLAPLYGRKLYVIGDSHAGVYKKMLNKFSQETGVEIIIKAQAGCGITNLLRPVLYKESSCSVKFKNYLDELKREATKEDIIFLATLKVYRLVDQNSITPANLNEKYEEQYNAEKTILREMALEESFSVLSHLTDITSNIILDAPKPVFNYVGFRCADWYTRSNPICQFGDSIGKDFFLKYREPSMNSIRKLANAYPDILIWDAIDTYCGSKVCSLYQQGKPVFLDADHLSGFGNELVYNSFRTTVLSYLEVTDRSFAK